MTDTPNAITIHDHAAFAAAAAALAREAALEEAGTAAVALAGTAARLRDVQGATGTVDDDAAADVRGAGND
ncbi:MAG: hypothetical protein WBO08_18680 [Mycobacterium sp.]